MAAELALILHAHLPYVRPVGKEILEERWLYEAVAESYLPLLSSLERLVGEGVPVKLAISLSGPLLSMLSDQGLMARCRGHLARLAQLADREAERLAATPFGPAAAFHQERIHGLVQDLDRREGNLLAGFQALSEAGAVELFTAAGTHAYLPLLGSDCARRAQIEAGVGEFTRLFGRWPSGIWLPECAYGPGLDHLLAAAGVRWFVADAQTVGSAYPAAGGPVVLTPGGVAAFGRDPQASRQVWDRRGGYPGDPAYREFYKDTGYELPLEQVGPWLVENVRGDTGLKFYRITGEGVGLDQKEPYNPAAAMGRALQHARDFAWSLRQRDGLVVAPFDAELFGHWWFEGPLFLEQLFRDLRGAGVRPVTPGQWLEEHSELPVARLPAGSWGDGGDNRVWLSGENDWLWPEVHAAEERMAKLVGQGAVPPAVLNQAARELLLAESSDWPFILHFKTAADYARRRVTQHLERFHALADGSANPMLIAQEDGIFPGLNGRSLYRHRPPLATEGPLRILMLSWEFPPNNVGGLGRHVHDLGAALSRAGHRVRVITVADPGAGPSVEVVAGMQVYRVARPPEEGNFLAWVYRLNQGMVGMAEQIAAKGANFDVVHCHDWLAGQAGMALKARWGTALIATIHATERGRNGAIRDPLQQAIHEEEWLLCTTADQVITVSQAMAREVEGSFRVEPAVIHNGVTLPDLGAAPPRDLGVPYFSYVGRLVQEKGVQTAIGALVHLAHPAHLVVAGRGPMEEELRRLAQSLGVAGRVHFIGRVSDAEKDGWLQNAAAGLVPSLYEPFGIVALEVMAARTPVIVGDTGGLSEIVTHGVDGLKFQPGDATGLAALMDWLLESPDAAAAMAQNGRETAAVRFSWEAIAEATTAIYRGRPAPAERPVTPMEQAAPTRMEE
ncbi:MAG: 1,4-alpha-glucan branching protein domain-containing protein [Bacillota bacterium]